MKADALPIIERKYRIAFSFAGEKRDYVEKVAHIVAQRFGEDAILYDKFHEAEFAIYDLGIRLPKLYGEQSDLIVPIICPNYDHKRWTGWEWVHIYGLLTKADGHRVMPSRFDHATADGLGPVAGFIELDRKTPEQFAALILKRLAINEGKPDGHYTKGASRDCGKTALAIRGTEGVVPIVGSWLAVLCGSVGLLTLPWNEAQVGAALFLVSVLAGSCLLLTTVWTSVPGPEENR